MEKKKISLVVCVLAIALVAGVAEAQTFDDMVGHWKLDETGGTSVYNSVTGVTDYNALVGGPTWISRQAGNGAVDFDSANASDARYVTIADYDALSDITGDRSVAAWFRVDDWYGDCWAGLVTKGQNTAGNYNLMQGYENLGGTGGSKHGVAFQVAGQPGSIGGPYQVVMGSKPVDDGDWHLAVGTYESASGLLSIYVDGVLDADYVSKGGTTSGENYESIQINGFGNDPTKFTNSSVDDVRVYNRALSAADVTALYDATVPEPATMVLLGLGSLAMLRRRRA